jgi:hydrogenase maturation factor
VVDAAAALLFDPGISVVGDAVTVRSACQPRLLHDPTEGGIATALYEMAAAAAATLRIDPTRIHVLPETEAVCGALGLDPLGLLASGALLAIVAAGDAGAAIDALRTTGAGAEVIGEVERGAPTVIMGATDRATPFPTFARDEIARFYDGAGGRATALRRTPEGL